MQIFEKLSAIKYLSKTLLFVVEDFEMFDNVVDHIFKYFNADPTLHPVLISEDPVTETLLSFFTIKNYSSPIDVSSTPPAP